MWFRVQVVACRARGAVETESHAEIWFHQIINVYIISKSNSSNTSAIMLMRKNKQLASKKYSNLFYCGWAYIKLERVVGKIDKLESFCLSCKKPGHWKVWLQLERNIPFGKLPFKTESITWLGKATSKMFPALSFQLPLNFSTSTDLSNFSEIFATSLDHFNFIQNFPTATFTF